jgi:hypothetical protein
MLCAASNLLDDFRALPGHVERPRTLMEIAGYPHYENACSNILAFFMDPEESHGLGSLVLEALASAGDIADADEGVGGKVSINREVITDAGNRIDILIESDDRVVLVESKIYASAVNPFDDYADYLDRRFGDRANRRKILLTLYPTAEGSRWGFTNLTHEEFVQQIRSLLGRYVSNADARFLLMFLDFLNTLENLRRGTRMDREFVKFLAERHDDVKDLFAHLKRLRTEMREKVQELQTLIDTSQYPSVEAKDLWRADAVAMFDNLYFKIRVAEDLLVGIDTHLSPHGWHIQIFPRDKGDPLKLRALLENLNIPVEEKERFIHTAHFPYDAPLDRIRPVLQDVVDKLAKSPERNERF